MGVHAARRSVILPHIAPWQLHSSNPELDGNRHRTGRRQEANEKEARKTEITIGSLFDGIGGFPLAGQRNGMTALWASEIEPFPIKVTKIRFPNMKHLGDITKIDCNKLEPVDIVTGGSPCQDLSVAGKRAGLAGARSGLFMEQIRIVRELREIDKRNGRTGVDIRPRFMVWENVPGAFSSNKSEDFRAVLEETARIADETAVIPGPPKGKWNTVGAIMGNGWSIAWRILDAQYWGVPQRRRRIYLVADFGGQSAPEILFKREGLSRHLAEGREAREGIAGDVEGGFREAKQYLFENHSQDTRYVGPLEVSPIVSATFGMGGNNQPFVVNRAYSIQGSMIGRADKNGPQGDGINEDVSFTLNTTDRHAVATKVYGICSYASNSMKSDNPHSGIYEAETSRTIDLNGGSPACNQGGMAIVTYSNAGFSNYKEDTIAATQRACIAKQSDTDVVLTYQRVTGPLMANSHPGSYTGQDAHSDMLVACPDKAHCLSSKPQLKHREDMDTLVVGVDAYNHKTTGDKACSLTASSGSSATHSGPMVSQRYSVRRLTPTECERLQDFPDGWTDIPGASDSARYKALGNSIAVCCAEYVLEGIKEVLEAHNEK